MYQLLDRSTDSGHRIARRFVVRGRRTSIRMESIFWQVMEKISRRERRKVNDLISEIDDRRQGLNLTAAVRVFAITYFKNACPSCCAPDETSGLSEAGRADKVTIH